MRSTMRHCHWFVIVVVVAVAVGRYRATHLNFIAAVNGGLCLGWKQYLFIRLIRMKKNVSSFSFLKRVGNLLLLCNEIINETRIFVLAVKVIVAIIIEIIKKSK